MKTRIILWVCLCLIVVFPVAALAQPDPGPPPCPPTTPDGQPFPCPEDVRHAFFSSPIVTLTFHRKSTTTIQTFVEIGNNLDRKKGFGGLHPVSSNINVGDIGRTDLAAGTFPIWAYREGMFLVYLQDKDGKYFPGHRPMAVRVVEADGKYKGHPGFPRMKPLLKTGDSLAIEIPLQDAVVGPFRYHVEISGPRPLYWFVPFTGVFGEQRVYRQSEVLRFEIPHVSKTGDIKPILVTNDSWDGTYTFRVQVSEANSDFPVAGGTLRTVVRNFSHPGDIEPPLVEQAYYSEWGESMYFYGSFPKEGLPRVLLNDKEMEHICDKGGLIRVSYADEGVVQIPFHVEDVKATVYTVDLYWESTGLHTQTTLRVAQDPKSLPRR